MTTTTTDAAKPKYPHVTVRLTGEDGNAFLILALCHKAARRAGISKDELDAFQKEATTGDYMCLIATTQRWFTIK